MVMHDKTQDAKDLQQENAELRARLEDTQETLRAIRSGEVDALVVSTDQGEQVFTLKGADHPFRVLMEDMSEGALTLSSDGIVLYANQRFAEMLKSHLNLVAGSDLVQWIQSGHRCRFYSLLQGQSGQRSSGEINLVDSQGALVPTQFSLTPLETQDIQGAFCAVVTDLSEHKRLQEIKAAEQTARARAQEAERYSETLESLVRDLNKARKGLKENQNFLESVLDTIQDGIVVLDKDMNIIKTNRVIQNLYSLDHSRQEKCYTAFHGRREPCDLCPTSRAMQTGNLEVEEIPIIQNGVETGTMEVFAYPMRDEQGNITGVVEYARDISKVKRNRQALKRSQALLSRTQEIADIGSWEMDLDKDVLTWSDQVYRMFGYAPQSFQPGYQSFLDAVHPEDRESVHKKYLESMLDVSQGFEFEHRIVRADSQEVRYVREQGLHELDDAGRVVLSYGAIQDITENKLAADKLREREEKYRALVDQSVEMIYLHDMEGRFIEVNAAAVSNTGYTREELLSMNVFDLHTDQLSQEEVKNYWQSMLPGQSMTVETEHHKKDGSVIPVEVKIGKIYYSNQEHIMALVQDITERKQVHQELIARRSAEEANRAKSRFLANMSHEIRTPMNAVLGFARMLENDPALPAKQAAQAGTIVRSGDHLLQLLNSILDMSRIEAGQSGLHPEDFHLPGLIDKLMTMFELSAQDKGLELVLEKDPHLPPDLHADQGKLLQILTNLLSNAIKFTSTGEVKLTISSKPPGPADTACEEQDLGLVFQVQDSGPGITAQDQARLFEPFFQAQDKMHPGGTGLGLTISREYAVLMGGNLTVSSQEGRGSCFRLEIPVKRARTQTTPRQPASAMQKPQADRGPPGFDHSVTQEICEAVSQGDVVKLMQTLDEAAGQDQESAVKLKDMARNFEYDRIMHWLNHSGA
ncbi:MAG: PAS domain S-box protein [Desulfonatronospira sp. MSAO_Bac3]|nr:MAG: PAS domain S-box protein [Desulfonatronospira sp. MSAO_Bac3]